MTQLKLSSRELDQVLAIQIAIAWGGEGGEEPRLNWWNTEVMSECGGYDNLEQLAPNSAKWLGCKAIREAARRIDESLRVRANNPDNIFTLYRLGFELDEQLDHRLSEHIHSKACLLQLFGSIAWFKDPVHQKWKRDEFETWLKELSKKKGETKKESIGRRVVGDAPKEIVLRIQKLATALLPLPTSYPFPHYRIV